VNQSNFRFHYLKQRQVLKKYLSKITSKILNVQTGFICAEILPCANKLRYHKRCPRNGIFRDVLKLTYNHCG
jgi:hypothetical protein